MADLYETYIQRFIQGLPYFETKPREFTQGMKLTASNTSVVSQSGLEFASGALN
jgi:hypothetical protein